jgi:hypothetical protein
MNLKVIKRTTYYATRCRVAADLNSYGSIYFSSHVQNYIYSYIPGQFVLLFFFEVGPRRRVFFNLFLTKKKVSLLTSV